MLRYIVKSSLLLLIISSLTFAQLLSIQGVARTNEGQSLSDGTYAITFRLYTQLSGGSAAWTETQTLSVLNGVFSANLGAVESMASLDFNQAYWLSLEIENNGELSPRTQLTLSPYAIMGQLDGTTNVFPADGPVGIGTTSPSYKLQVAGKIYASNGLKVPSTGVVIENSSNDRAIMQAGWISPFGDFTAINSGYDWDYGSEPISILAATEGVFITRATTTGTPFGETLLKVSKTGNVGIGTASPTAKLDVVDNSTTTDVNELPSLTIGNLGRIGGNQITGNRTGLAFKQYMSWNVYNIAGTIVTGNNSNNYNQTYMAFYTRYNDESAPSELHERMRIDQYGNVGIGTTDPTRAKLVVNGHVTYNNGGYGYLNSSGNTGTASGATNTSIFASQRIIASEFNAISDARIKSVIGRSNSQNDLNMLNQLKVIDYKYVDVVARGDQVHKKIIAQELEKIYPVAVLKTSDYIPNVYQSAVSVQFDNDRQELTIKTVKPHEFASGDQIKLSVIIKEGTRETEITPTVKEILDDKTFIIDYHQSVKKCFVFGKQVDDFRVVDYEALSMLNVSATQELANQVETFQAQIAALQKENESLRAEVRGLTTHMTEFSNLIQRVRVLEAEQAATAVTIDRQQQEIDAPKIQIQKLAQLVQP